MSLLGPSKSVIDSSTGVVQCGNPTRNRNAVASPEPRARIQSKFSLGDSSMARHGISPRDANSNTPTLLIMLHKAQHASMKSRRAAAATPTADKYSNRWLPLPRPTESSGRISRFHELYSILRIGVIRTYCRSSCEEYCKGKFCTIQ